MTEVVAPTARIDDRERLARVVHEELLAGPVLLAHDDVDVVLPEPVAPRPGAHLGSFDDRGWGVSAIGDNPGGRAVAALVPRRVAASEAQLASAQGRDTHDVMTAEAAESALGGKGLFWLPYLQRELTPHLDPAARGVLFGLTTAHRRGDVFRAVMEGVAFSLRDHPTVSLGTTRDTPCVGACTRHFDRCLLDAAALERGGGPEG